MTTPEKVDFVFGGEVSSETWDDAPHEQRLALVVAAFGDRDGAGGVVQLGAVEQLLGDDAPETWAAAERMAAQGLATEAIINQLAMLLASAFAAAADDVFDDDEYRRRLATLPYPSVHTVADTIFHLLGANNHAMDRDALIAAAEETLGIDTADPLVARLVERVTDGFERERLVQVMASGLLVDHHAMLDGITLTHTLTAREIADDALDLLVDLYPFVDLEAQTADGSPIEVDTLGATGLRWVGPGAWLAECTPGSMIAVRVDRIATASDPAPAEPTIARPMRVTIDRLAEPLTISSPSATYLAEALGAAHDAETAETLIPMRADEATAALLLADRSTFTHPQPPLSVLCDAAGLERRGADIARSSYQWGNARVLSRLARLSRLTGDDEGLLHTAAAVLEVCDELGAGAEVAPRDVRQALEDLRFEPGVLPLVDDQLFADERGGIDDPRDGIERPETGTDPGAAADKNPDPVAESATTERLQRVAAGLAAAARRDDHRSVASYLAARIAEAAGDWSNAERFLEASVRSDGTFASALDRLAWYRGDRGDAARALQLWSRIDQERNALVDVNILTVAPFADAVEPRRNDPCWCGSGRKYKQCHTGSAAQAPLAARVGWVLQKATNYLDRISPEPMESLVELAAARYPEGTPDADDPDAWIDLGDDPLLMDLLLHEAGWWQRFLDDRGPLLPDDERELATAWLAEPRRLFEVVAVAPVEDGDEPPNVTLADITRDEATSEQTNAAEVRGDEAFRSVDIGDLLCARLVPLEDQRRAAFGVHHLGTRLDEIDLDVLRVALGSGDAEAVGRAVAAAVAHSNP